MPTIRLACEHDAEAVARIYRPFCESTAVSFEYEAPSTTEMARRIAAITERFPWVVLEDAGRVLGYAYASPHRERAAYAWAVDVAVYLDTRCRRRGAGTALYTTLLELLRRQGCFKAYAGITLPNPPSAGLHEALGFRPVGVYAGVGYKLGAWHDVAWYQLALQPERPDPALPVAVADLPASAWTDAVSAGLRHYRSRP
jgi:L-amino acid N-acyltransferase YncA